MGQGSDLYANVNAKRCAFSASFLTKMSQIHHCFRQVENCYAHIKQGMIVTDLNLK